jgi:glucose/arabinose dehydrogenase
VRVQGGRPVSISDFVTGFLPDPSASPWGRPVDVLVLRDGSLLVSDDFGGRIFRVHYVGR